jgi:hypothetical protein
MHVHVRISKKISEVCRWGEYCVSMGIEIQYGYNKMNGHLGEMWSQKHGMYTDDMDPKAMMRGWVMHTDNADT